MTVLQIAGDHCANWRTDGKGCLGAIIEDDGAIRRCIPKPKCVLSTPGQRCPYFEECVAPMARSIQNPNYRQQFEEALRAYRLAAKLPSPEKRVCPLCRRVLQLRRRFCYVCAATRRRESARAFLERRRVRTIQLMKNGPLRVNDLHGGSKSLVCR